MRAILREVLDITITRMAAEHKLTPALSADEAGNLIEDAVDAIEYLYVTAPGPIPDHEADAPTDADAPPADQDPDDGLKTTAAEVIDIMSFRRKRGA